MGNPGAECEVLHDALLEERQRCIRPGLWHPRRENADSPTLARTAQLQQRRQMHAGRTDKDGSTITLVLPWAWRRGERCRGLARSGEAVTLPGKLPLRPARP